MKKFLLPFFFCDFSIAGFVQFPAGSLDSSLECSFRAMGRGCALRVSETAEQGASRRVVPRAAIA
jgi:hypothetical protein